MDLMKILSKIPDSPLEPYNKVKNPLQPRLNPLLMGKQFQQ